MLQEPANAHVSAPMPALATSSVDFLSESAWPEADADAFQEEIEGAPTVVRPLSEMMQDLVRKEASLDMGVSDDSLDNEQTRVRDEFEAGPTQAVAVMDADDLVELVEEGGLSRSLDAAQDVEDEAVLAQAEQGEEATIEDSRASLALREEVKAEEEAAREEAAQEEVAQEEAPVVNAGPITDERPIVPARESRLQRVDPDILAQRQVRPPPEPVAKLDRNVVLLLASMGFGMMLILIAVLGGLVWMMQEPPAQPVPKPVVINVEPSVPPPVLPDVTPKPIELPGAILDDQKSMLKLTAEPGTAQVFVDDKFSGTTPLELPQEAKEGKVKVIFKAEGFLDEVVDVEYKGNKSLHVIMRVKPAPKPVVKSITNTTPAKPAKGKGKKPPKKTADPLGKW